MVRNNGCIIHRVGVTKQGLYDLVMPDNKGIEPLNSRIVWEFLRLVMGWIFLWAFLDKLFGLGFSTPAENSWLNGVSPTLGYLKFATHGVFGNFFQTIAGSGVVDVLFMGGMLLVGVALTLGIGMKIATWSGTLMMFLIFISSMPPEHNPLVDEHVVYILVLLGLNQVGGGQRLGLADWWGKTRLVRRWPILQ